VLLKLFPSVRSSELSRFKFFLILAGLLFCSQATAMTVCESLLLSRLGLSALPPSVLLASALTMLCSFVYSKWVGKHRNEASLIRLIGLAVLFILLLFPLVYLKFKPAYVAIFAFHFVTFTILSSHLQALANDYFDTLTAKRIMPLVGVGATAGEVTGGLSASAITRVFPIESLLIAWAGFLILAALFTYRHGSQLRVWNPHPESLSSPGKTSSSSVSIWSLLKQSALNRSLLGMVCFMIMTMPMVQYVVSDVFVTAYPKDAELASFLGMFVALSNTVELFIASLVTPKLLSKFGVARTNMVHAVLAILTLGLLWNHYTLVPAALAWINRKTIHDALAAPTRRLVFNAVPLRERAPLMAFVMGVAGSAARAAASITLVLLQGMFAARTFILFGLGFGVFYLLFVALVARNYLATLLKEIVKGRLSVSSAQEIDKENLPLLWAECLKNPENHELPTLARALLDNGHLDLLKEGALLGSKELRVCCIQTLVQDSPTDCLQDPDSSVRLAAVKALWRETSRVLPLCQDPDPVISRLAQAICGLEETVEEAEHLRYLHSDQLDQVRSALHGADTERRVAALRRLSGEPSVPLAEIFSLASHPNLEISLAAVDSLSGWSDPMATVLLARCLRNEKARVRRQASQVLRSRGPGITSHVEPVFRSELEREVRAAYECFRGMHDSLSRELLGQELRLLVREAWKSLALCQNLKAVETEHPFLVLALNDRASRCERLAFRLLALLEGDAVVSSVLGTLRFAQGAGKSTALEVLSNLGDREAAGLLVLLTEPAPLPDRLAEARKDSPTLSALPVDLQGIRAQCLQSPGRYVSVGARNEKSGLAQRLLKLSQFDVLQGLSLEDLEQVDKHLLEERFAPGEKILTEGQPCPKIYLIVSGDTDAQSDILGEVSALDEGTSLITVKAKRPTRTYSLTTANLRSLVRRQPSVAFPLIKRLTKQLREQDSG
jgi:HEAT repeat protein